ncbi:MULTISPECIES: hypothetical protein [unclassified Marinobacter]|jgi:hypothetical protein|uniref:hypothetical protein n=1 Tax=unclassified Marinobacter TaxID=83889 RepID=UPI00200E4A87|nr:MULTISPECIES: hypothetical protein [unclassified Marinobacter]MCL1488434.1 hypothetical protein [Marinobacter sp.]UQG57128.1 hypothetical protein MIH16_05640 [Marinobacter sp. M4C]UQG65932.1 hypothetical protein MIH17_05640 [Marinobacter sp. M2C]UQG70212.1 hypothetical protein MIH19_05635 [Marinobacter sp. M1C]
MKTLQHQAEQLRANTAALSAVTALYEQMRADFLGNADHPDYLTEYALGGLERAMYVVADSTAKISDSIADEINKKAGQK